MSAPPSDAPPEPTAPTRLAKISSACKILPASAVVQVLGSSSGTKLKARELPVDKSDGEVAYTCAYGKDGQEPFALTVSTRPDKAAAARTTIDNIAAASGAETTPVDGVGEAGVGYVSDSIRIVVVTLPYEDDLRLVLFAAPEIVPQDKLVEVVEQVVEKV
ncbi:hypothetical protein SAMN05421812_11236 [Asanoa hainanensis]|uniref:DUF3558 domain-containing protein n=1 Tax=Asanoa hainanensis TaxID=560556 RepID=A0A239P0R9_9ACTN|nr:hypothetical protein SAMN05421812_11236 [Asanoa hainanensis]